MSAQNTMAAPVPALLHHDPSPTGPSPPVPTGGDVLQPSARRRLNWKEDLQAQVAARNAAELAPTKSVFQSYAALHARVLALQYRDNERAQLEMANAALTARVRELERAAADMNVRSAREMELEAKKDELQDRVQAYMQKENEFYRGLAELATWKDRTAHAESRAASAEADLDKRNAELALIKKEYVSLREENQLLRVRASDTDATVLNLKAAQNKLAQQEKKIKELEKEVARLQLSVAGPQGSATPSAMRNTNSADSNGVEQYRHPDEEEELTHQAAPQNDNDTNPSPSGASSMLTTRGGGATPLTTTSAAVGLSPYPRRAALVIEDAHNGAILQTCCVADGSSSSSSSSGAGSGGSAREVFTSASDKVVKIWDTSTMMHGTREEKKRFSSGGSIALSLHSSSHYLIAGCVDKVARFWDTRTLRVLELVGHAEKIVAAALSATGQHAFTASSDSTIKLWDVRSRATLKTLLCQSTANDVTVAGENIFSCHYNGNLTVWDRRTANRSCEVVKAHQRIATCVRITHDGRLCVSLGKDNAISVRDTRVMTRELRNIAPAQLSVGMNWSRLAVSPDSKVAAVGSTRGQVICVALDKSYEADIARACPFFQNNFSAAPSAPSPSALAGEEGVMTVLERGGHDREAPVHCVAWGREPYAPLISIGEDKKMVIWQ